MLDRRLRIRRFTANAEKLLKAVASDIGRPLADIRLNIDAPDMEPVIAEVLESLQPWEREVQNLEGHWYSLNILPYRTQDNKIDGVVLALQDIDAIKSANEQLRKSTEFFRGIVDTVREPLLVLDPELRVITANEPFLSAFKVSSEQTVNRFLHSLGNGEWDIPTLRPLLQRALSEERAVTDFVVEHDFESIGRRTMVLNARRLSWAHDAQLMILLAIEDITERRQADGALRESEERFRTLFTSAPMAVFVCDRNAVIQNYNRRAAELWGREPVCGVEQHRDAVKLWLSDGTLLPQDQSPEAGVLRTGNPVLNVEAFVERPNGSRLPVLLNSAPLKNAEGEIAGAITSFIDIRERKFVEAALIKSEKLAAAGRLAATLAHEINNPLQAVTNLVTLLGQSPRLDTQERSYATMATEELDRLTHLTRQSLSFYREITSPMAVNVEEVIESVLNLYGKQVKAKQLRVTKRYLSEATTINSYPGEIRQVFSTLLVNAMEAVPGDGTIAIRVSKALHSRNRAIHGVRITIADNGVGISPNNQDRIFEPFFTTKGENGTGLGLWTTQGIVSRLSGSIQMRSSVRPGKSGTCFSIFLPSQTPNKV
jgi:two-component system CheB/CheR fusion protein